MTSNPPTIPAHELESLRAEHDAVELVRWKAKHERERKAAEHRINVGIVCGPLCVVIGLWTAFTGAPFVGPGVAIAGIAWFFAALGSIRGKTSPL